MRVFASVSTTWASAFSATPVTEGAPKFQQTHHEDLRQVGAFGGTITSLVALFLHFHPYYVLVLFPNTGILWIAQDTDSALAEFFGI